MTVRTVESTSHDQNGVKKQMKLNQLINIITI